MAMVLVKSVVRGGALLSLLMGLLSIVGCAQKGAQMQQQTQGGMSPRASSSLPSSAKMQQHTRGRVSVSTPEGWEQKPGELTFRTGKGTENLRFIAVSEIPVSAGQTPQQLAASLEQGVLSIKGTQKIAEATTKIGGQQAHEVLFNRVQAGKQPIKGKHITVPFNNAVVTILWYVYESDWQEGSKEMEQVVATIAIK